MLTNTLNKKTNKMTNQLFTRLKGTLEQRQ